MKSPGITISPLLNIARQHIFNEVFFDNVRIPASNLVGEENRGWYYLMTSLGEERGSAGGFIMGMKRVLDELINYVKEEKRNGEPLSKNPLTRQRLADIAIENEMAKLLNYRLAWEISKNILVPNTAAEIKFIGDGVMEHVGIVGMQILGPYSQLKQDSKWVKMKGTVELLYLMFLGIRNAMGTDEVQKNIIAQFGLGLPRGY
jgi:hypothetical protein